MKFFATCTLKAPFSSILSSILKISPTYHISWRLQCSNRLSYHQQKQWIKRKTIWHYLRIISHKNYWFEFCFVNEYEELGSSNFKMILDGTPVVAEVFWHGYSIRKQRLCDFWCCYSMVEKLQYLHITDMLSDCTEGRRALSRYF